MRRGLPRCSVAGRTARQRITEELQRKGASGPFLFFLWQAAPCYLLALDDCFTRRVLHNRYLRLRLLDATIVSCDFAERLLLD
jgi:hypothetical protein